MNALEVVQLTKAFNHVVAVNQASFEVPEGSIFGLIGRNGAGKTTTLRLMMNIYMPDSGEIKLRGASINQEFRDTSGYLPEERGLYKKMKVWDTLMYFAEIKGKTGKDIQSRAQEYLKRFDLFDRRLSKIDDLSKGNQQKIQFIITILHDPEFIILDEPFSGMDPINTELIKEIILEMKGQGKIIILSTHLMDFAEKLCDHIAMIDQGKIILKGSLREIKASYARQNVSLECSGDISFLESTGFVEKVSDFGNAKNIRVRQPEDIQQLLKLLVERNIAITRFIANEISLHEIFVELAGGDAASSAEKANHA
jgi:ABC-2 type transport system ATP-binding protein